ncbi:hypothetical protein ZWY2020_010413 [Hordeum vulgare]|nr:hypothetical protein ZWY2020_010413 [Hordeum vulgare]
MWNSSVSRMGTPGFSPKNVADIIAGMAYEMSWSKDKDSPFSVGYRNHTGTQRCGGKEDDITIVVSFIVSTPRAGEDKIEDDDASLNSDWMDQVKRSKVAYQLKSVLGYLSLQKVILSTVEIGVIHCSVSIPDRFLVTEVIGSSSCTTTMVRPMDLGTTAIMISSVAVQHARVRRSISCIIHPGIQQHRSALPHCLPVRRLAHRGHQAKAGFPRIDLVLLFAVLASPASFSYRVIATAMGALRAPRPPDASPRSPASP